MKPKMIIFDYGDTLVYERNFDFQKGYRRIFEFVVKNPDNITCGEAMEFSEGLFSRADVCRKIGFEVHEFPLLRATAEYFGPEFSEPMETIEKILQGSSLRRSGSAGITSRPTLRALTVRACFRYITTPPKKAPLQRPTRLRILNFYIYAVGLNL